MLFCSPGKCSALFADIVYTFDSYSTNTRNSTKIQKDGEKNEKKREREKERDETERERECVCVF